MARTGRPKGYPKTGGRTVGTKNKVNADIREAARQYCPDALEEIARIAMKGASETSRLAACTTLLDRGHGKPAQIVATDPDNPLQILVGVNVHFKD